jgi:hypothetical protein
VAVLKTIAVAVLLHGIFTLTIPYWICRHTAQVAWVWFDSGLLRWSGAAALG